MGNSQQTVSPLVPKHEYYTKTSRAPVPHATGYESYSVRDMSSEDEFSKQMSRHSNAMPFMSGKSKSGVNGRSPIISGYGYMGMTPGFGENSQKNIDDGYQFPILGQQYLPPVNPYASISHGDRMGAMRPVHGVTVQDVRGPPDNVIEQQHSGTAGHPVTHLVETETRLLGAAADALQTDKIVNDLGHYGV